MSAHLYNRTSPFMAQLKKRYRLNSKESKKATFHVIIDISGSGMHYSPGDSLAVLADNAPLVVDKTIAVLGASGDEMIRCKKSGAEYSLRHYLTSRATITRVSRKIATYIAEASENKALASIVEHKETFHDLYNSYHLWDFLEKYPSHIDLQTLCDMLHPITPRLYSIASSQNAVGHNEVHLTVSLVEYTTNNHHRYGVCSHYLCETAPLHGTIPVYIQKSHGFSLPEDGTIPIIMVGPGTGVAPFRSFMQERLYQEAPGKNWLFYGDWTEKYDFCYGEYWKDLEAAGVLRLDTAFSRDQEYKIYVQQKIAENGEDIWQWLNKEAHFYVCGDAKRMAKDVENTLHEIAMKYGEFSDEEATAYLTKLKESGRYQQDIY